MEIFWYQNQGTSLWGSRDIKRFRPRHKNFFSVFRNQGVIKRVEIKKNFDFGNYCSERENKSMLNIAKNCNIKYGLFESVLCETCLYA